MALFILLMSFATSITCQQYHLPSPSRSYDLQVDGTGSLGVFVSSGRGLYRLSSNLELEETRNLTSEAVNISLSTDGRCLVVCLTDLSCEVYNATNLSAEPVFRRENVTRSPENVALFAAKDSFYVGSISIGNSGVQEQITLSQYKFTDGAAKSNDYDITRLPKFERNIYGGFVSGNHAYYFAVDNNPSRIRDIRVMRVCHNSDFSALYELTLGCGGRTPSSDTRISGVSLVDGFAAGVLGPIKSVVVLSRSRPESSQNYVCLYNLTMIDSFMQGKYDSCSTATGTTSEQIELAWKILPTFCNHFLVSIYI